MTVSTVLPGFFSFNHSMNSASLHWRVALPLWHLDSVILQVTHLQLLLTLLLQAHTACRIDDKGDRCLLIRPLHCLARAGPSSRDAEHHVRFPSAAPHGKATISSWKATSTKFSLSLTLSQHSLTKHHQKKEIVRSPWVWLPFYF